MKKKWLGILLECIILSVALLTGCTQKATESSSEDGSIITIQMSDEAKKYLKENIETDGVKDLLSEGAVELLLEAVSQRGEQVLPECTVTNTLDCMECEGNKVYTLTKDNYENVILYTHGGAWVFEISKEHIRFCDDLATKLNAKVYMPLYPLAPEATSEETYACIESLYKEILKEGKNVYIMGDSAGGNITLGLMHTIKEEGLEKPKKMVLIAPCSDMTFTNPDMEEMNKTDPELHMYGCSKCAEIWAGKENLADPKNSAVYADLEGYPDTMLIQGTNDILAPDNMILYQRLKDAKVNVSMLKGEGFWHVFPIYPIPESETALNYIQTFCAQ